MRVLFALICWLALAAMASAEEAIAPSEQEEFAWSLVKETTDPQKLMDFVALFPRGIHVEAAVERLRVLPGTVETGVEILELEQGEDENRAIAMAVQKHLQQAGCAPGSVDGSWGPRSNRALTAFARAAGIVPVSTVPTTSLLEQLQGSGKARCPVPEASPPPAPKYSVANLKGRCMTVYKDWKRQRSGKRAFAMSIDGNWCGYTQAYDTLADAKLRAVGFCSAKGAKDCAVVESYQ